MRSASARCPGHWWTTRSLAAEFGACSTFLAAGAMSRTGKSWKKGALGYPFVPVPRSIFASASFYELSHKARSLLLALMGQYNGNNNGDFSVAWTVMKQRGWKSEDTLSKAKHELIQTGFLFETRKGRMPNLCSLYALTCWPLNPLPKYDEGAEREFVKGAFHKGVELPQHLAGATDSTKVRMADLQRLLGVNHATVWRLVKEGRLPQPHRDAEGHALWKLGDVRRVQQLVAANAIATAAVAAEGHIPATAAGVGGHAIATDAVSEVLA